MPVDSAQRVAELLNRHAELLESAAVEIRRAASRAANGEAGSTEDGLGYHFLVDLSMRTIHSVLHNASLGEAFRHAAEADKPA